MPTKAVDPSSGFQQQIDEMDALLDRLLQLPIDKARPATLPLKPASSSSVELKVQKKPATAPILHFDAEAMPSLDDSSMDDTVPLRMRMRTPVEEADLPEVHEQRPAQEHSSLVLATAPPEPIEKIDDIPWIDDEPLPSTGKNSGPKVEIIQGPSCDVIIASSPSEKPGTARVCKNPSLIFWLFWTWTWCFDQTLGYWFPWLRRSSVKFLLGLCGIVCCVVSIYLAWTIWLR